MAYLIKTKGEFELPVLRDVVLQTIVRLKYKGRNYRTESYTPFIFDSKKAIEVYMLGRVIDPKPSFGFDSLLAVNVKHKKAFGPDFFEIAKTLDFLPNWILMCGIESAHGFDIGPLHKNLSNERLSEATSLGQRIKEEVKGIENLAFVHYEVDNREIISHLVNID